MKINYDLHLLVAGNEGKMSDSLRWFAFVSYGVGHVLNDLVASMWFTYALVFYHYVMQLSSINAGAVVLVGQLTDAVATAAIGVLSDNVNIYCTDRYGRRKTWHLFGKNCQNFDIIFILPTYCIYNVGR